MAQPKKKMGRPKKAQTTARTVSIRASVEWAEWLERLAKHYRTTVAGVVDRALAEWTESQGYEERPPERTP